MWVNGMLCLGLAASSALATDSGFGLGFIMGDPSGISAKIETGKMNSLNLELGYDNDWGYRAGGISMGADYVWYNYQLIPVRQGKLPLYFGPGVRAWTDSPGIGIRAVVGLEYQFVGVPFDAFIEAAPGIDIVPSTQPDFSLGIGARYFF